MFFTDKIKIIILSSTNDYIYQNESNLETNKVENDTNTSLSLIGRENENLDMRTYALIKDLGEIENFFWDSYVYGTGKATHL